MRHFMRTTTAMVVMAVMFSLLFIVGSLLVHGHVNWK